MNGFLNNTMRRVDELAEHGGLSDTIVALAIIVGVIVGLFVAELIVRGIACILGFRKR